MKDKLRVLYEDNHIIVVLKPANLLSQADATNDMDLLTLVKQYVKEKYQKPGNVFIGLVHRLDRPVSGIMVLARTSKAASRLSKQVAEHSFQKEYLAVIHGKVESQGTYQDDIIKMEDGRSKVVPKGKGKEAILSFERLDYLEEKDWSLVKIKLKTGRHHQIRAQFAYHNHPLCGDQRYGKEDHTQIALHAFYLSFFHPITKERMEFQLLPEENAYFEAFALSKIVK